jgi:hypothetical protein
MTELAPLRDQILKLMSDGAEISDVAFNQIALDVFRFQFENNEPYRKYCERRNAQPGSIDDWLRIPAVPTAAFKEAELVCGNADDAMVVFRTSGTTRGREKRGAHYVLDLEMYDRSLLPTFKRFVLADVTTMPIVSLIPAWHEESDSSLSYMVSMVVRKLGAEDSRFVINESGIAHEALHEWLDEHISAQKPVCILGTSLAVLHWFDHLRDAGLRFDLPQGSRIMDTGGFKGSTRSITSEGLRMLYDELLGVDSKYAVNEYGMTEMLSQFYDAQLANFSAASIKQGPPWVRTAVVDPESLEPLPEGTDGLLRHFDLANLFSVSAIQTEDLGIARDEGFEMRGRADGAAPRGCSIAMDMFLSSTRG